MNSYERCVYESVDDYCLSYIVYKMKDAKQNSGLMGLNSLTDKKLCELKKNIF